MILENKIFVVLNIYFDEISFYLIVVIVIVCYDLIKFSIGEDIMRENIKKDIFIIGLCSLISAILYIFFGNRIMEYGRNLSNPILLRFLPVLLIQFGMSCLGILIVAIKNHEKPSSYGLTRKNWALSVLGCLTAALPTLVFLYMTNNIHGFFPFQGMFLTKEIVELSFPLNILGYFIIALVWGMGEGLFYVVLARKINLLKSPKGIYNLGALVCAVIAILIHGMVGTDLKTILEASVTFVLMYGSILTYQYTDNIWGNILIFFFVWNAW